VAFKKIKEALLRIPTLHYFVLELETCLKTNASDSVVAGVMS
jgi:hypothetical protein